MGICVPASTTVFDRAFFRWKKSASVNCVLDGLRSSFPIYV